MVLQPGGLTNPVLLILVELLPHLDTLGVNLVEVVFDWPSQEPIQVVDATDVALDSPAQSEITFMDVLALLENLDAEI